MRARWTGGAHELDAGGLHRPAVSDHCAACAACVAGTSPFLWGTRGRLEDLFGVYGSIYSVRKQVAFRAATPAVWVDKFCSSYVPVLKAFAVLGAAKQRALQSDLLELVAQFNRATDGTMTVDAEYLEVVVTRR